METARSYVYRHEVELPCVGRATNPHVDPHGCRSRAVVQNLVLVEL